MQLSDVGFLSLDGGVQLHVLKLKQALLGFLESDSPAAQTLHHQSRPVQLQERNVEAARLRQGIHAAGHLVLAHVLA